MATKAKGKKPNPTKVMYSKKEIDRVMKDAAKDLQREIDKFNSEVEEFNRHKDDLKNQATSNATLLMGVIDAYIHKTKFKWSNDRLIKFEAEKEKLCEKLVNDEITFSELQEKCKKLGVEIEGEFL